jgi:cellulose 1,4-beta-cellobiosidase
LYITCDRTHSLFSCPQGANNQYQIFKLKNQEFTFDVDMSQLPCGLNGALYFVQMDADGGMARFPTNKAGAKYGTGYCDSQCPRDIKFINGQVHEPRYLLLKLSRADSWDRLTLRAGQDRARTSTLVPAVRVFHFVFRRPTHTPKDYGTCCAEMDIWEANSNAEALTPHPCTVTSQTRCTGDACGGTANRYGSACDPDGCDFNRSASSLPFRL